jgi:hypothetical protein
VTGIADESSVAEEDIAIPPEAQIVHQPLWESLINQATVVLLLGGIVLGNVHILRTRRQHVLAVVLGLSSFGYVLSLVVRFLGEIELMGRIWSLIFSTMGIVLALGLYETWRALPERSTWLRTVLLRVAFPAYAILVFLGGITAGWPPFWGRLPGPYLVSASERSIELQGVAAAEWANDALEYNSRIAADFTNYYLMGSYGEHDPEWSLSNIFLAPTIAAKELNDMRFYSIGYIVVDQRLSQSQPVRGWYFDGQEEPPFYTEPLPLSGLTKFDDMDYVSRIFDSGDIIIYQIEAPFYYE